MAAFPVSLLSFSALLLLTIGWLLHCDRCFADSPDIRNAPLDVVAMEYPPYTSAHMPGQGLTFIALRKQLQHSGWRINPVFLPPARAVRQLFNDRDWLLSIYAPDRQTSDVDVIPLPGARFAYSLFRRRAASDFRWQSLKDLSGHSLTMTRALNDSDEVRRYRQAGLTVLFVDNIRQGLQMLLSGRTDFLLTTRETGHYYLQQLGVDADQVQFADTVIQWFPYTVYLNRQHPRAEAMASQLRAPEAATKIPAE